MVATTDQKARLLDLTVGVLELVRDGKRGAEDVARVLQTIKDDPEFYRRFPSVTGDSTPRVTDSDLVITLADCDRFLHEFCGVTETAFVLKAVDGVPNHLPVSAAKSLTYERLAALIMEKDVPRCDWTVDEIRAVDTSFDCRQPERDYLLWTPAGIEAVKACPILRGVSYRTLWKQHKQEVLAAREAIILWLLVWWKTSGAMVLDSVGWTRTGSRRRDGHGVVVYTRAGRLGVRWHDPDGDDPYGGARSAVSV